MIRRGRLHRAGRAESAGQLGKQPLQSSASIREAIPEIGDHETIVVMHNDAVVQGLSQLPYLQERGHWGVLTIGTVSAMRGSPTVR